MADDQDQPNSGTQDDGSTASRSESGNRPKDGISDDQLEHDFISVEALSSEDLQYIVGNAKYRHVLSDLLSPYLEKEDVLDNSEAESEASADRTGPADRLERGTDHTRLIQVHHLAERRAGADTSALSRLGKRPSRDRELSEHSRKRQKLISPPSRKRALEAESPGPSTKRLSLVSDSHSDSDTEEEWHCFNPEMEREDKEEFRMQVSKTVRKYIEKHFCRSLSKQERTAMLKRHPKPDTEAAVPPKLDNFISDFAGKKLDKARDAQLARIQGAVLYAANPLTCLWSDLADQGLTQDPKAAILVSDVLDIVQRSLVLLWNANNLISETRRETALESIHPSLKKYGKGDFSNSKCDLFGQEFKDGLVKKVEADAALFKAVSIVARSVGTTGKIYQKQPSGQHFSQGSRTSRYGAVSGRVYNPYNYQGKGKYLPGKPHYRKGNVFNRLGPRQADRTPQNNSASHQQK